MPVDREPTPSSRFVLTGETVAQILFDVGFKGEAIVTALAVAKAESDLNAWALNYAAAGGIWGPTVGLFQVRVLLDPKAAGNSMDRRRALEPMKNAETNARFAYDLSGGGRSWRAWSAYTNGAYRQYLAQARAWALDPQGKSPRTPAAKIGSVPLVDNDWIDEDRAALPIVLEGAAHPGDLGNAVVSSSVELSMAEASQVTLELEDQSGTLLRRAKLTEGVPLRVGSQRLLVTSVGAKQGPGSPHLQLTAQPAGVVRLRGVTPATVNLSPVAFARRMAKAAGMPFVGGPPAPAVDITPGEVQLAGSTTTQNLDPLAGMAHGTRTENAWEVLRRLAGESEGYVCFEAGGTLHFATQDWLMRNGGVVYVVVGSASFDDRRSGYAIRAIGMPTLRRVIKRDGQNRPYRHVEADIMLPPGPGWKALPGMRLWLAEPSGIVGDARPMLIQTASYSQGDRTTPVRVRAASYTAPGDVDSQPTTVPDSGAGSRGSGTSQNGWPASSDPGKIGIGTYTVPGSSVRLSLANAASRVLLYVAAQFDERVERLKPGTTGGYNYRTIAGSDTISNHGSGTAIDLNWSDHPHGRTGTFSRAQVAEIRRILAECQGVIRWGGDWSGSAVDEMHFEIAGDPSVVKSRFG